MTKHLVFTTRSLGALLHNSNDLDWLSDDHKRPAIEWEVVRISNIASAFHFIHREDSITTEAIRRISIVGLGSRQSMDMLPPDAWRSVLQRIHRAALSADKPPLRLPAAWAEYHHGALIAFFASNWMDGAFRWIAQVMPTDICFLRMTHVQEPLQLEGYRVDDMACREAVDGWSHSLIEAKMLFSSVPHVTSYMPIDGVVDLKRASYEAVTGCVQYSLWKDKLTEEQQRFFNHSADKPLKLRGPAGSGKTLTLELKALREMYAAREAGSPIRILYATHSWEMAEQVDAALASLDETGSTTEITIFPLIEIAKSIMPPERQASGLSLLGHDSLSGKRTQLQRISSQASAFKKKDWLAYAIGATDKFRQRVETSEGSPIWNSLIWDLMHEFSSVLAASSILPSITAERRYLSLNRTNWMMPLQTDSEKKFVFRIYASYLAQLKADRLLSVDQLITDFLSYLESFAWDYRRNEQGFDLIFVDELHLFSDPERHVLNLLTRDPSRFPSIFMALDPRQAPSEVYFDFPITSITSRESGDPERSLGKVDSLELTVIHRFSPQILNLIKFINNSFPTFYLGTDWVMDISALNSRAEPGGIPKLYRHDSTKNEVESVISRVKRHVREGISSDRLAVILIEENRLDEFIESVQGAGLPYVKIQNRDDIDTLRYAKRSIVFAAAEYIAGLQFEEVIVAGFPVEQQSLLNPHQKRRILSLLYLAISRASIRVELHLHSHTGEFAVLLEPALAEGVLDAAT